MTTTTRGPAGPAGAVGIGQRLASNCPRCGQLDQVRTVPAAHAAGRQSTKIRAVHYRPGYSFAISSATASTSTELSRQLAPPPQPRSWITSAIGLACAVFLMALLLTGGVLLQDRPDPAAVQLLVLTGGAALGLAALTAVRLRRPAHAAGANLARHAWRRAHYCGRCHGVFFPASAVRLGVPTGRLLTPAALSVTLRRLVHREARGPRSLPVQHG